MIILGIDPALTNLGWGVVRKEMTKLTYINSGVIKTNSKDALHIRLAFITACLEKVILEHKPNAVALEETFVNMNNLTSLKLGYARGAIMALIGKHNIDFREFKPNTVKKTVTGYGHAEKHQILHMIKLLLPGTSLITSADGSRCGGNCLYCPCNKNLGYKMTEENKFSKPTIILVCPQMGENIGATARAMKNFALGELRIVNPRDGWPNEQARSTAVGAVNVIDNAKIYDTLEESIKDIEYLYATTCTKRTMNKDYVFSQDLSLDYPLGQKAGIMFGRENNGLSNEEVSLAHKIITINTSEFSSLNIAQAVIIICYELFCNKPHDGNISICNTQKLATRGEVNYFLEHLFNQLDKKNFFKVPEKTLMMKQNITNIFTRIDKLSGTEVQTLRGIIKALGF